MKYRRRKLRYGTAKGYIFVADAKGVQMAVIKRPRSTEELVAMLLPLIR